MTKHNNKISSLLAKAASSYLSIRKDKKSIGFRFGNNKIASVIRLAGVAIKLADGGATHVVSKGETLSGIAKKHGIELNNLVSWNSIKNPDKIRVGQTLRLSPAQNASTVYVKDKPLPKSQFLSTSPGKHDIITYPQGKYVLSAPLSDALIGQLALEAGPKATPEQIKAILDIAINRGSGSPEMISADMGTGAWWSRAGSGVSGRMDVFNDPGYAATVKAIKDEIAARVANKKESGTDHTMFRHTTSANTPLNPLFVKFPQALTATNELASVTGKNLVTYRNDSWRHSHPVTTTAVASNK